MKFSFIHIKHQSILTILNIRFVLSEIKNTDSMML